MRLQFTSGTDTAANASAYIVTGGDWASGTITWANMPGAAITIASNISHNNATGYTFSCKTAVQYWYYGSTTGDRLNYGIMLRYYNESVADYNAVYSADCTTESKRPALTITYTPPSSSISVLEGKTYTLTAPSVSGTITWSSSNTSVATVNSSGKVTGVKAGKVTISASVSGTVQKTYTVYVRIPNGVYRIKNSSVDLYIGTMGSITDGTATILLQKSSADTAQLRQIWKITYLDKGYYSIRPMYKLDMALGLDNASVSLYTIGTTDSYAAVPSTNYWSIVRDSVGYAFKYLDSNGLAIEPGDDTAVSGTGIVVSPYSSSALDRHWELEKLSDPPAGAVLYNTTNHATVTNPSKYLSVGATQTLSAFNLCAAAYSDATNSQSFYWYSSDPSVAKVDSSTGAVTGISPGTAMITGRVSRGGSYHYVKFGICVGFPTLFNDLIDMGCIPYELCDATEDGLFLSTVPLSAILSEKSIHYLPTVSDNSKLKNVATSYDDWYIYAVDDESSISYGLFKMREEEIGASNSQTIGVTISFVSINSEVLLDCLIAPTTANKYSLYLTLVASTGPDLYEHDDILAGYFARVSSTGAYLIAEKYVSFMASIANNGTLAVPEKCVEIIDKLNTIDKSLADPLLDANIRVSLLLQRKNLARIPDALEAINASAGHTVYDNEDLTVSIADAANLTLLEKQAILSCFTANVTFNSFAAEVQFHAAAVYDWKTEFDDWYEAAVRADMAIGEDYESGFYDEYYDLSSDLVQAQIDAHGKY